MDSLIQFGGEVKALGAGAFEAPLIRFGDAKNHDLAKDFFDASTDYWTEFPGKAVLLYDHGQDETLKSSKLGGGTVDLELRDGPDAGVWMKGQLNTANQYEAAIYKLMEMKKLGTSSGAVSHLVTREAVGEASYIKSWPIYEASLTPTPCEGRNFGKVVALKSIEAHASFKSLLETIVAGETRETHPVSPCSLKAVYLGANAENSVTLAAVRQLNDLLMYSVVMPLLSNDYYGTYYGDVNTSQLQAMTLDEKIAFLSPAFDEFRDMSLSIFRSLLAGSGDETKTAAAKAIIEAYGPDAKTSAMASLKSLPFSDFLKAMGTVAEEFERRVSWVREQRATKQGRTFSQDNSMLIIAACDGMQGHLDKLRGMVNPSTNQKEDAQEDGDGDMNNSGQKDDEKLISAPVSQQALQAYFRHSTGPLSGNFALIAQNEGGTLTF